MATNQPPQGSGSGTGAASATGPDFGKAGKFTARTDEIQTAVHTSQGEFLSYTLTVKGAKPVFTFSCEHRKWLTNDDLGTPSAKYEWPHFQKTADEDAPDDVYGVAMSFLAAPMSYTLVVNKLDKDNNVVQKLKDIDVESTNSSDFFVSTLRVLAL